MLNFKKAFLVGTVLTALCATAAYAADNQTAAPAAADNTKQITQEKPNCPPPGNHPFMGPQHMLRPGPYVLMTQAERDAFKQHWETWKQMTPEQKEAAYEKFIQERIDNAPNAEVKEKLQKLQKRHQEWKNMTPAERKAAQEKMRTERLNKLTDAQRTEVEQFIKDDHAHRQAMKERLEKMTPEQRACIHDANMIKGPGPRRMGPAAFPGGPGPAVPPANNQ